jgi:membrane protein implicated in regulation of membrane protease activity
MKVLLIKIQLFFHSSAFLLPTRFSLSLLPFAILIVALVIAALVVVIASSRHKKSSRAPLDLVGRVGTIVRDLEPEGAVLVGGELFPARTRTGEKILRASGARVRVVGARAHFLEVERKS